MCDHNALEGLMRVIVLLALLAAAAPASGQIQMRPTDPPLVTAANDSWYILGEPIQFSGELYYRAGATVFFNGNAMVRIGHYNGVPLYADTTVEPFSIILVPVSRGVMQPYERPRSGELAGTSGSRAPSFPTALRPATSPVAMAASPPTAAPAPIGAISVYTPEMPAPAITPPREAVATSGMIATRREAAPVVIRRPQGNDGIWIQFMGLRWVSTGRSVSSIGAYEQVGEYAGLPVYRRGDLDEPVIYLPTAAGRFAPYRARE
jgi:hypothetical protein